MAAIAAGCADDLGTPAGAPPSALVEPPSLTDLNPDPDTVEVDLVAGPTTVELLPGNPAAVWAYRDGARPDRPPSVPGPVLRAKQGDEVLVHFRNELDQPTTVHWHGLRVAAQADGTTATQEAVRPGQHFDYHFRARDAGTFWYHPHVAADLQVERGLYGPIVVTGGTALEVTADRVLVLDDVKLLNDGQLAPDTDDLDRMFGRQGNILLVNGRSQPAVAVAAGARERWRFVNAANGRYFNLRLPGHRLLVIAWDGGLVPEPYEVDTLLVAPGERYEVLVQLAGAPGSETALQTVHYDRGQGLSDPGATDILRINVVAPPSTRLPAPLPKTWRDLPAPPVDAGTAVRPFVLGERSGREGLIFFINGERWPLNVPIPVKQGELEIWEVRNETDMDHPFHLHGMFFDLVPVPGAPPPRAGWKDTVNVPRRSSVRFAVRYEPPGMWMFHCTILEHAELGMMGELMVRAM